MQGKTGCQGCKLTFAVIQHSIKVLDVAEAVAAQLQAVGAEAQAIVANIKGALPAKAAPGWSMSTQPQPGSACLQVYCQGRASSKASISADPLAQRRQQTQTSNPSWRQGWAAPLCREESPVEWLAGVPVGYGHLHQRAPVHHRAHPSLIFISAGTHMACSAQL